MGLRVPIYPCAASIHSTKFSLSCVILPNSETMRGGLLAGLLNPESTAVRGPGLGDPMVRGRRGVLSTSAAGAARWSTGILRAGMLAEPTNVRPSTVSLETVPCWIGAGTVQGRKFHCTLCHTAPEPHSCEHSETENTGRRFLSFEHAVVTPELRGRPILPN
ncbi:hypothetical protein VTK73DRAFT_4811 [Phialemonium thermophilum]|uniref:Uncharacterized protein n=1 Tax=Phialemonium thermophilum TaxID=223376 RepID=A0ABR3WRJ0_9PEZI